MRTAHLFILVPVLVCVSVSFTPPAGAHRGGIDAYGCHNDRKHGGYHCHHGLFAGEIFSSKSEMIKQLNARSDKSLKPALQNNSPISPPPEKGEGKETCIREKLTGRIACGDALVH